MINLIFCAQSDTTAGFFSKNAAALNAAKNRELDQKALLEISNLSELKKLVRAPRYAKKAIRRGSKITFIYQNKQKKVADINMPENCAIRINTDELHAWFLREFGMMFASSANLHDKSFDMDSSLRICDILALDSRGIFEGQSSQILRLGKTRFKRIR
ncbi:MAG: Sua5/YciO/YrdC/YwlC family protein [Helicobacter sp.]|nr:Sua5/YciO/YrdC/YwlC family protein [Helicobacter sp.]